MLLKLPCYKSVTNLIPLRKSALRKLLPWRQILKSHHDKKVFMTFFESLLYELFMSMKCICMYMRYLYI